MNQYTFGWLIGFVRFRWLIEFVESYTLQRDAYKNNNRCLFLNNVTNTNWFDCIRIRTRCTRILMGFIIGAMLLRGSNRKIPLAEFWFVEFVYKTSPLLIVLIVSVFNIHTRNTHTHTLMLSIYVCVCIYMCAYMYMYICIYVYICIYI